MTSRIQIWNPLFNAGTGLPDNPEKLDIVMTAFDNEVSIIKKPGILGGAIRFLRIIGVFHCQPTKTDFLFGFCRSK